MGYAWNVGDGNKVRFWEDMWFGNSSLAIQFWPVYVLVNEKGKDYQRCLGWLCTEILL